MKDHIIGIEGMKDVEGHISEFGTEGCAWSQLTLRQQPGKACKRVLCMNDVSPEREE